MSAVIIPFPDPYATLEGEEREAVLADYREYLKAHVRATMWAYVRVTEARPYPQDQNPVERLWRPEFTKLNVADLLMELKKAMRTECDRTGL